MGGTPLFDASERPHRRQDNLRGCIANSLPVKLAAYNLRSAFGTGNSAFNAKTRAIGRIFAPCDQSRGFRALL